MKKGVLIFFTLSLLYTVGCTANRNTEFNDKAQSTYVINSYGDMQVAQMLSDRPKMKLYNSKNDIQSVTAQDEIWKWSAQQFGKEIGGQRIHWNSQPPTEGCELSTNNPDKGYIQLPLKVQCGPYTGQQVGFQNLWKDVIFELCDIQQKKDLDEVLNKAKHGYLSEEAYITSVAKVEFVCTQQVCEVFEKTFKPWAKAHYFELNEKVWGCPIKEPFAQILKRIKKSRDGYWEHYSNYYRNHITPSLKRKGSIATQGDK